MNWRLLTSAFISVVVGIEAHAYELGTHARLTQKAYEQSVLGNVQTGPSLLKDLGIEFKDNPFGDRYYDVTGTSIEERSVADTFELTYMPAGSKPLSIAGWLLRGAIREDDVLYPDNGQPVEDPYNTNDVVRDNRVLHHFYDPANDRALSRWVPLSWIGVKKAPDWAIGAEDAINDQNSPESYRRNHFTVFDAREAMYRALTGKNQDNQDVAPTKEDRNKYWATLFRALGDIVHLVQDMGQPQHTRNDPHAGKKFDSNFAPLGHKSIYEAYVEARATGGTLEVPGVFNIAAHGLTYDGYTVPRFTDYLSYFTTRQVDRKEHA